MRARHLTLGLWPALAAAWICALAPVAAAKPLVGLRASFVPYQLGKSTTVRFGFDVTTSTGEMPPPLTGVDLSLPAGLNQNASQLGLDICKPAALVKRGPSGCPVNSKVGFGSTNVEVAFGGGLVKQEAQVSAFAGPPESAAEVLFYNESRSPIASKVIYFGKSDENAEGPFAGALETTVPLIPTVPEGNFLATTSFESTLGPLGLTYQRTVRGKSESFRPEGIILPGKCPRGGFQFQVELRFADGSGAADHHSVPCPPMRSGRR